MRDYTKINVWKAANDLTGKCKDVRYSIFNLPHNEAAENKPPLEVKVVAAAPYGAVSKNE